jgi:Fe-S cluster biogenesis protein NfuA
MTTGAHARFTTDVADAVDEIARLLRADGADLTLVDADAKTARVRLTLVLDSVSCEECVLPPAMLFETIEQSLQRRVGGEFELLLDDPRTAPDRG